MYFVYVLQSIKDKKYYIGSTQDVNDRLTRHNNGSVKSTANRRPFKLVYSVAYQTRSEALKREKEIKSYKGGNAFKHLIAGE